ncbi:MAG: toll/interleukin-1 receptor domain-containing protein [Pseudomonadota bacterium]
MKERQSPDVFMSYSHDSEEHKARVLALANRLREEGIICEIDQYINTPLEEWPQWMIKRITKSKYVLVICTETYCRRVNGEEEHGVGKGAKWEGSIITKEIYNSEGNIKFIPIIFEKNDCEYIPIILKGATHYNISDENQYDDLYRYLTDQKKIIKPPIGKLRTLKVKPTQLEYKDLKNRLLALGKDVIADGNKIGGTGNEWNIEIKKFYKGSIADIGRFSENINEISKHNCYIILNSEGAGRLLKSPIQWYEKNDKYYINISVEKEFQRQNVISIGVDLDITNILKMINGLDRIPQMLQMSLGVKRGEALFSEDRGSDISDYFARWGMSKMFEALIKLEISRLASIPYEDNVSKKQYTPLRCVNRVIDVKLISDEPIDNKIIAEIELELNGHGNWKKEIELFIHNEAISGFNKN